MPKLTLEAMRDPERLARELAAGGDPEALADPSLTPLAQACMARRADIARALLEAGADPNRRLPEALYRVTPLHCALGALDGLYFERRVMPYVEELLFVLLDAGADPDATNDLGHRPLVSAVGHPTLFHELLARGAPLHEADRPRLVVAASGAEDLTVLRWLLGEGFDPNARVGLRTALVAALVAHRMEAARVLLAAGADPNAPSTPMAIEAPLSRNGPQLAMVRELLASGARIDEAAGQRMFRRIAAAGQRDLLPVLLDAGVDVQALDGEGRPLFDHARNTAFLAELVDRGLVERAELTGLGLGEAAKAGDAGALGAGLAETFPERYLHRALHAACTWDQPEMVALLLNAGADAAHRVGGPTTATEEGAYRGRPLVLDAFRAGDARVVKALLARGAADDLDERERAELRKKAEQFAVADELRGLLP